MTSSHLTPNNREVIYATGPAGPVPVAADVNGNIKTVITNALIPTSYDYISYTNTSSTVDTYVFKTGGSSGVTVATLTITYTDNTKNTLSSVAKS